MKNDKTEYTFFEHAAIARRRENTSQFSVSSCMCACGTILMELLPSAPLPHVTLCLYFLPTIVRHAHLLMPGAGQEKKMELNGEEKMTSTREAKMN